jgi:DNA-binding response OmpR family regulator
MNFGTAPAATCEQMAGLPLRMKVLYITTLHRNGGWLAEAFAADGAAHVAFDEVVGVTAGLARLRDEVYDVVLVSHEPGVLDAIEFVDAFRAGGNDEPLIILGHDLPQELDAICFESGADDYGCVAQTTVRGLLWKFARALRRCSLARENRRLLQAERQRLQQEHHEAERLLEQQRALITDLELLRDGGESSGQNADSSTESASIVGQIREGVAIGELGAGRAVPWLESACPLPAELVDHYRELLRTYVIMGAGNLGDDMSALAELLADSNISAQRTMQLHVEVLEELVQGLGNRSARHVMNRADLLALEVLGHLADGYRQRYRERRRPPRQQLLPGFDHFCHVSTIELCAA